MMALIDVSKSDTLRVMRVRSWTSAVAAMNASIAQRQLLQRPLRKLIPAATHCHTFNSIAQLGQCYDTDGFEGRVLSINHIIADIWGKIVARSEAAAMGEGTWTVAQAKAKFSEVIDLAQSRGPQTVTRNGRTVVVVVAAKEWERKTKRSGSLAEFFAASPLRGSHLKTKRLRDRARKVDL